MCIRFLFSEKNKALKLRVFWGIFSVFLIQSRLHTITLQLDACVSKEDSECSLILFAQVGSP